MTELHGFVCIVRKKRRVVARLVDMVRSFKGEQAKSPESCLIKAPPGSGKSHLVKQLARVSGCRLIAFNLTHLFDPGAIVHCFEMISTTQADTPNNRLLIFFDEVNAKVAGELLYPCFLTVLDEGIYEVSGRAFYLRPAIWIFAGTEFDEEDIPSKAADFNSRLTRGVVSLYPPAEDPEGGAHDLERIYLGALLLKRHFPEIEWISEDVLDVFKRMPSGISVRALHDFTRSFCDVRRRSVGGHCIPWRWLESKKIRVSKEDWSESWKRRGGASSVRLGVEDGED